MSTVRPPGAFPLLVDHDLLLDLRHLDDPDPPQFGALRAEEAAQRATHHQIRRARLIAGSVLVVALVAGIGVLVRPDPGTAPIVTAIPPTSVPPTDTTMPDLMAPPSSVAPTLAPPPGAATTTVRPPGSGAAGGPGTPPATPATGPAPTLAPARPPLSPTISSPIAPGPPPDGTVPPPAGISLVLTLDRSHVAPGDSVRGVVRFRNERSRPVTLGATCSFWRTYLYRNGAIVEPHGVTCMAEVDQVVAPGAEVVADVQVGTTSIAPGTYDVYTTVTIAEDRARIHSQWQILTVVQP